MAGATFKERKANTIWMQEIIKLALQILPNLHKHSVTVQHEIIKK